MSWENSNKCGDTQMGCTSSDNPWHRKNQDLKIKDQPSNCSFRDLMSEDMAKDLHQREEDTILRKTEPEGIDSAILEFGNSSDTKNDFMLAVMLQHEYNKEHDDQIQREEKHYNKNSKLCVSFSNFKLRSDFDSDSDEDNQYLDDENRAIDSFEESRKMDPVIPPCGYIRHNNEMVTKHDKTISGRRNAERVMNFPPGFNTGDAGGFDMQISNKVYNNLARTAMNETKRKQRIRDKEDKAIVDKALDRVTKLIVYKLVNNSTLENVNEIVSTGKESIVFHASGGIYEDEELPSECAVKVFKTTLTDFKTREKYIKDDYRFKDRISKNTKGMIKLWAEKEFHNLVRLQKANIPSPKPLLIKKHILIMSFIGDKHIPAPKLKQSRLSFKQWCDAYEQVVTIMTTMFQECNLVHGDMSEYNILWYNEKCWVIDLGQAVEPLHPHSMKFLYRDCTNVIRFFRSKGLADIPSPLNLLERVSGISLGGRDEDADRVIEEYEINREHWRDINSEKNDQFEFLWRETKKEEHGQPQGGSGESSDDAQQEKFDDLHSQDDVTKWNSDSGKVKKRDKKKKKKTKLSDKAVLEESLMKSTTTDRHSFDASGSSVLAFKGDSALGRSLQEEESADDIGECID